MRRYPRPLWFFAAALAALAGFVDAIAFLQLGGYFVSFMSGNSTRMGASLFSDGATALKAAGLIAAFVAGVVVGSLTVRAAGRLQRPVVLLLTSLMLAVAGGVASQGDVWFAGCLLASAMGCENAAFERDGEQTFGVTYMTGALVKLGQGVATALIGQSPWAWAPYLLLWSGLVCGVAGGAMAYRAFGFEAVWAAAAVALLLAVVALVRRDEV